MQKNTLFTSVYLYFLHAQFSENDFLMNSRFKSASILDALVLLRVIVKLFCSETSSSTKLRDIEGVES